MNNHSSLRTGEFHLPKQGWFQLRWDVLLPAEAVWGFGKPQGRQPVAPEFCTPERVPCVLTFHPGEGRLELSAELVHPQLPR